MSSGVISVTEHGSKGDEKGIEYIIHTEGIKSED